MLNMMRVKLIVGISLLFRSLQDKEKWGVFRGNRMGTGIIGSLLRAEADIGIGTITPRTLNHLAFDFSTQHLQASA